MSAPSLPRIEPGKRVIVAGRTGSGKTVLAGWLAQRSPQRWIVFNPKHTSGYDALSASVIVDGWKPRELEKSLKDSRFTILNFKPAESLPQFMDACIGWLHDQYDNVGIVADELYTLHDSGRPLPGLTAWLTRGRERKQSFIGLTQRPVWISRFCFSEADYIAAMALQLASDRKAMVDNTGRAEYAAKLAPYLWRWYNVAADELTLYGAVPVHHSQED